MAEEIVHSLISPSMLKQIMLCPKSLPRDSEALDEENVQARTGTLQHAYLNFKLSDYFGLASEEVDISSLSQDEINEVESVYNKTLYEFKEFKKKYARVEVLLEEKIDLDDYLPSPSWGFVDIAFIGHRAKPNKYGVYNNSCIYVLDAKFGYIEVKTLDDFNHLNPQLSAYWCGIYSMFSSKYQITRGNMMILQPKLDNYPFTSVKAQAILDYMETEIKPAAYMAFNDEGEYNPSISNCRMCKNSRHCKFHNIMAQAQLQFLEQPDMLSDQYIEENILPNITNLKKYCDNTWDYCVKKSETTGKKWKGFTLGTARPTRIYADEEKAKEAAVNKGIKGFIVETILTPAQAEKALGKDIFSENFGEFVTYKPGKPTLVADATPSKKASKKDLKNEFKGEN